MSGKWRRTAGFTSVGAVLGVLLLHPATMAIYWFEFQGEFTSHSHLGHFISDRMAASFTGAMLPMTLLFAALGALFGVVQALFDARLRRSARVISHLEQEMVRDIPTLIRLGESEHIEFKSTARWDLRAGKVSKVLVDVVAKTIAALANHQGGSLLIGVADDGEIVGLEHDYRTLKSGDRDGFTQLVMTLVRERLGGHVCRVVHVLYASVDDQDVCRVVVEPADEPVYLLRGSQAHFFVRTGNASRELDAREIVQYVASRWRKRAV